jgi:hypothetical protein
MSTQNPATQHHPRPKFDSEASLKEAEARLPFERLIEQFGHAPKNGNWKSFSCPFCQKKGKAGLFTTATGTVLFKCQSTACSTGAQALPIVQFFKQIRGLGSDREAFEAYRRMAGVWQEHAASAAGVADDNPAGEESTSGGNSANGQQAQVLGHEEPQPDAAESGRPRISDDSQSPLGSGNGEPTEPDGTRPLRWFFERLAWSARDDDTAWLKRGLTSRTCEHLRFRSNPKSNRDLLLELRELFDWEELEASGLWLPASVSQERRPNCKFAGLGAVGKKANSDDREYGWNEPLLIPNFDAAGKLIGLRPHKDMGPRGTLLGTPQLYIPRGPGAPSEKFPKVIVTEGELKAGALWQVLGAGRMDGKSPVGVAALPGISFGKHYEIRATLEEWLRSVGCSELIIAFDNEEKGDPALPAFKSDRKKRFDAHIWAIYLARALSQTLHLQARVCFLPKEWRNAAGKSDWDGAAARIIHGTQAIE